MAVENNKILTQKLKKKTNNNNSIFWQYEMFVVSDMLPAIYL